MRRLFAVDYIRYCGVCQGVFEIGNAEWCESDALLCAVWYVPGALGGGDASMIRHHLRFRVTGEAAA